LCIDLEENTTMNQTPWKDKLALITGASGGIGAATAERLAKEGLHVILTARRADRLEALAGRIRQARGQADVLTADLSTEAGRMDIYNYVMDHYGRLDVLVNNAGIAWFGFAAKMPWSIAHDELEVNIVGLVQLTLLFLPMMEAQHSGHIINLGSIAGVTPQQGIAIYAASKAFISSFTTSIYRELKGSGVSISVIRPGPVSSEFFDATRARQGSGSIPAENMAIPPQRIADAIWGLLRHPRRTLTVPWYWGVTSLIEPLFGWAIDLLGPVLIKK
jgi:short-subunit dehydrogenase